MIEKPSNTKSSRQLAFSLSTISAWILAARLKTLPVSIASVVVGGASVFGKPGNFNYWAAIAALLGAILLQIGSNLANDVFDFEKGSDANNRIGPARAAQSGLLTPLQLKLGMIFVFIFTCIIGSYLVYTTGYLILIVGIVSILCAVAYTGGPFPLGYNCLGELFVFIFFGPVAVCCTGFVILETVPLTTWIVSVSAGALATNVLIVNNIRDIKTDADSNKKTLIVCFGKTFGIVFYGVNIILAFAALPLAWLVEDNSLTIFLPILSLPFAVKLFLSVLKNKDGSSLNKILAKSAMLTLLFGSLLAVGLIL